jgi:Na+/phosphate symporter
LVIGVKKQNFTKITFKDTIQSGHCDNVLLVDLGVAMVIVVVMVFLSLFSSYNGGHRCDGVIVVFPILAMVVVAMVVFMLLFLLLRWCLWS